MGLRNLFHHDPARMAAGDLYRTLVAQSRSPGFYTNGGVADTLDGRFDLVALHVALVITRLQTNEPPLDALSQSLFDEMVANLDVGLREAGVGDTGVGKRMKKMVAAFYGRSQAYQAALVEPGDDHLIEALERNLFRGHESADAQALAAAMAGYVRQQYGHLATQSEADLVSGRVSFQPFECEVPPVG